MEMHPFSIYLLKENFDATNSLKEGHKLQAAAAAGNIPAGSTLYILDSVAKKPWWKDYFGVQETLLQASKGALLFLPVGERCFALSFGHVFHHLNDYAYEYDFGLRVTLNSLDPNELKSADMVDPSAARRKRTQVPVSTELTYLDFDGNSEIIKGLTGKVKAEYIELFKSATGSSSLKISLKLAPDELGQICETLLTLYESEEYKTAFPNIQNIIPVKDPEEIDKLDALLLASLQAKDGNATLTVPDIVDYRDNTCCIFQGKGSSNVFPDISLEHFYEYLGDDAVLNALTINDLKKYCMVLTDIDGAAGRAYGIYRSLIFDIENPDEAVIYHICEGEWYKVEQNYLERLRNYLDQKCEDTDLCAYNHDNSNNGKAVYSEENYNEAIPVWQNRFICLDQTDISPRGSTAIEPCDIYTVINDNGIYRGALYHIKISTRSSQLSHLFNQGVNSIELIQLEPNSLEKIRQLITDRLNGNDRATYLSPFIKYEFKIIFGIITHKDPALRSQNLPLFSKISLMRNMQRLDLMKVPSALTFIRDESPKKAGHSRHQQIAVQVYVGEDGKSEVRPLPTSGFDNRIIIKNCPKAVKDSAIGTRYLLSIKRSEEGDLSSFHSWPFELLT